MRLRLGVVLILCFAVGAFGSPPVQAQSETYQVHRHPQSILAQNTRWPCPFSEPGRSRREDEIPESSGSFGRKPGFYRLFKILDRGAFLFDPQRAGFRRRNQLSELERSSAPSCSSTGVFEQPGDTVSMRCACSIRCAAGSPGKRYTGNVSEIRKMDPAFLLGGGLLPYG